MRPLLSVVLLLLQLGPFAGAGICMHAAAQPQTECSMPMNGMPHDDQQKHSRSSQDCAAMVVCAPAAPMILQVAVQVFSQTQPSHTNFSTPASLFAGDAAAPPQPPPIV
ncbi:MAG: hypothetical protein SGJ01_16925 [Gemmatimonadota bacterium]|nr:hypothetical protein [Gemmatimonadota bacterium]